MGFKLELTDRQKQICVSALTVLAMAAICVFLSTHPAFADYKGDIKKVLKSVSDIIGTIFRAVGVVLSLFSIGQLVLAFKNEDADAKTRASTQMVVGIVLIAMPSILDSFKIVDMFK